MLETSGLTNKTIWLENGRVFLIDQTLLPTTFRVIEIQTVDEMVDAIKRLAVRGAPAIGIAAAFGMYISAKNSSIFSLEEMINQLEVDYEKLKESRPTAVNLAWALHRIQTVIDNLSGQRLTQKDIKESILQESLHILQEDDDCCRMIGKNGAELLSSGDTILTHCNAGGLATASYGTALAPIFYAVEVQMKSIQVYADETRPLLQGARLTAWELSNRNIPVTVICDNMAASVISSGKIHKIIVGADRIAANGDAANKIGTLGLAVIAKHYQIPFYVAAPLSTFDFSLESGRMIPIEERNPEEIRMNNGIKSVPEKAQIFNPAFDVTPAEFINGFITENGVFPSTNEIRNSCTIP